MYLGDVLEYKDEGVRLCRCLWELEAGRGCVTLVNGDEVMWEWGEEDEV